MPSPTEDLLTKILDTLNELVSIVKDCLVNLCNMPKPVDIVTQSNCPICNKPLERYDGPYTKRPDGLLQHKHH